MPLRPLAISSTAAAALLLATCSSLDPRPPVPRRFPSGLEKPRPEVVSTRVLTEQGGHLDWCHADDRIAFAYERDRSHSEIFTIEPDGSNRRCVTCENEDLLEGRERGLRGDPGRLYRGAPAWHPSCEFLVIQVGTRHFRPRPYDRPPFGANNALWLVAADGSWAERIVDVGEHEGSATPHFSDTGDRLFWAARERTGKKIRQTLLDRTPGAENPYDGWYLAVADFERPAGGPAVLSNRVDHYREEAGWFSANALTGDTLWFSHTRDGRRFVDDIYRAGADGSARERLVVGPETWQDGGVPSPWGSLVTYRSSEAYGWSADQHPIGLLRLELFALAPDGQRTQLTSYNVPSTTTRRTLVHDHAWGPRGREIAVFLLTYEVGEQPRRAVEILRLNDAF